MSSQISDTETKCVDINSNNVSKKYVKIISWPKTIFMILTHTLSVYYVYLFMTNQSSVKEWLLFIVIGIFSSFGILCGAHRLWAHRSFKANLSLRILLMIMNTLAFQEDIIDWCRDHRTHHKHSDTDADPYNSSRGFFFCHMGWVFVKKHPDVKKFGQKVHICDLYADPVLKFQRKYYYRLVLLIWGIIPISLSMYLCDSSLLSAVCGNALRYVLVLHQTWTVNSFAHLYGTKPYQKNIHPRNNWFVVFLSLGEGYHNYHHVFPYDYSASEFGWRANWNLATAFIDGFVWLGWARDAKTAPRETIEKRIEKCGDRSQRNYSFSVNFWFNLIGAILSTFYHLLILIGLRAMNDVCVKFNCY